MVLNRYLFVFINSFKQDLFFMLNIYTDFSCPSNIIKLQMNIYPLKGKAIWYIYINV